MASSTPPIPHTSISPFLTEDSFRKKAINLNGQKIRLVTGWQPSIREVNSKELRLQAESFQHAQLWQVVSFAHLLSDESLTASDAIRHMFQASNLI